MLSYKPLPSLAGPLYGKDPWPLRFFGHSFGAACFNTMACSLIYSGHQFGTRRRNSDGELYDKPSGPMPFENWRDEWSGSYGIVPLEGREFPGPVEIEWSSMDGMSHSLSIDLDEMFKDRLILHRVTRDEVKESWLDTLSIQPEVPSILVEVNDRTVAVFMRALIATNEYVPEGAMGRFRNDLVLAWTHTY